MFAMMDDINLHYRFLNWRRRIREIREVRAVRYQERYKRMLKDGDTLSYQGNSDEVGCYVAPRPLSKGNCYFEVTIMDTGVRGTIAVGLVPQYYKLDHQPGWLPHSIAYHADDGKLYNGNTVGQQFGPKCNRGDRIGCGIYADAFDAGLTTVFFTKNSKEVGSVVVPVAPDGLFPAIGMHSLGEEVRLDLQAEWGREEEDSVMMVDSHEDEWGRLYDVCVSGAAGRSDWSSCIGPERSFPELQPATLPRVQPSGHAATAWAGAQVAGTDGSLQDKQESRKACPERLACCPGSGSTKQNGNNSGDGAVGGCWCHRSMARVVRSRREEQATGPGMKSEEVEEKIKARGTRGE
ncbi:hypothetical protein P4O66_004045 [Electrophorus voltai]|uniref:B30.2/SPRY domain-containing protein n=1 Tax=Electrophorus voltai TaxID=2609070 RepID=A0AAD8ZRI3_9TELE|nr:hypothetical protein P4O66_004045 [Electrophorus voltai]